MSLAQKLANTQLGAHLDEREQEQLANYMQEQTCAKGQVLLEEDTQVDTLYLVTTGTIAILKVINGENTIHLDSLKAGTMAGELAFIDNQPQQARLQCRKEANLLTLNRQDFNTLWQEQPQLCCKLMQAIISSAHQHYKDLNTKYLEMHRLVQNQYTVTY